MFILSLFPEWVYHFIIILGIIIIGVGFLFKSILIIQRYSLAISFVGILVLVVGSYLEGVQITQRSYEGKITKLNIQIAQAEAKSEKVNTIIVTKVLTKRELVKEKSNDIIKYIDREITNEKCSIPPEAIIAHNAAAQNKMIDEK